MAGIAVAVLLTQRPGDAAPAGLSPQASPAASFPIAADDPRFAACLGNQYREQVIAAFSFVAKDYRRHFPHMGLAPELEVGASAFAVVFAEGMIPPSFGGPLLQSSAPGTAPPPEPGGHTVCTYVGEVPSTNINFYVNVDIAGMRADSPLTPTPAPSAPPGYVVHGDLPITVLANRRADRLFDDVQSCVNPDGYTVS
ncbi:MAG TPA: hypothetical protein VF153_08465, partial [Candidatus Limnocylindria bacterium]